MSTETRSSLRKAAVALIAGALITAVGGAVVQLIVQPSTTVSDDMWSYPWSSDALIAVSLLWALAHLLVAAGLVGLRRSGLAGLSRGAGVGLALAVGGSALLFVAELASLPFRHQQVDDTGPAIVGALFGIATLVSALGLLLAGRATLAAGRWGGWRRLTPVLAGISALILVGLGATEALPAGVAIYGLGLLALGIALYSHPSRFAASEAQPRASARLTRADEEPRRDSPAQVRTTRRGGERIVP